MWRKAAWILAFGHFQRCSNLASCLNGQISEAKAAAGGRVRDLSCGDMRIYLEIEVRRVPCRSCTGVKREQLAFLADNPFYTKRFAHYVGRRCRQGTIKDIAQELNLDWDTGKTLEMQYMRAQLAKADRKSTRLNSSHGYISYAVF